MKRKNGDVTVGTLVAIVLAIVVIAFLVYGFSAGWTNLWGKVTDFGGGDSNVDDISLACQLACAQDRTNDFCAVGRNIDFGEKKMRSSAIEDESKLASSIYATCNNLTKSGNNDLYNVTSPIADSCPKIACN